jgi:hypothetical protein
MSDFQAGRRDFLRGSVAAGGGAWLALHWPAVLAAAEAAGAAHGAGVGFAHLSVEDARDLEAITALPTQHETRPHLLSAVAHVHGHARGARNQQDLLPQRGARDLEVQPRPELVCLEQSSARLRLRCDDAVVGTRLRIAARLARAALSPLRGSRILLPSLRGSRATGAGRWTNSTAAGGSCIRGGRALGTAARSRRHQERQRRGGKGQSSSGHDLDP